MAGPAVDPAQVQPIFDADARLTGPGAPFELVTEDVLGEPVAVYVRRPRSVRQILEGAAKHGQRDAYVFDDGTSIGYSDISGRVAAVATWLRDVHGVAAGDRVGVAAANSAEWILAFWAVTAMGASVVAFNAWWTGPELVRAAELTRPSVILADRTRRERLSGLVDVAVVPIEDVGIPAPSGEVPNIEMDEDDPALFLFTSGTTGRPKAAVLTHRSIVAYLLQQAYIGARGASLAAVAGDGSAGGQARPSMPGPRLAVFPLFHVSGLSFMVSTLLFGSPTLWPLGRFDAGRVISLTNRHGISTWTGATTHIHRLLDHPDIVTVDPNQLTAIGVGGSATTPDVIAKTRARFPHLVASLASGYGATETGIMSFAPAWMLHAVPNCVGPPLPGVDVRIVDDDGAALPDGVDGNVCVRSQASMAQYWDHDEANAEAVLPGRWIRLGDVGAMADGVLYLNARKRDLIIRGGENVYPFEVEHRLGEHPEVAEVAVFGVADVELGQVVKAVVVAVPGVMPDPEALRAFCAETLAAFKVPAIVELSTEPLPRTPTGKVMKHVLDGSAESTFIEE